MDKLKYFEAAIIFLSDGTLVVDSTVTSISNCFDKVTVRQNSTGEYIVKGYKRRYRHFCITNGEDVISPEILAQFTDESIKLRRRWPWSKKTERYLDGWCEYKQQKQYTYTTTELIVIE